MRKMIKIVLLTITVIALCAVARTYAEPAKTDSVVLAGGCFWGVEAVFEHTKGVTSVVSGYAGGKAETANYRAVTQGDTHHAESVKVTYDPQQISLSEILDIYFTVAHNPTQLNYQGPDHGTQYRSAIFYANDIQKDAAEEKLKELNIKSVFSAPIVTKLDKLETFYIAEEYHQDYAALNPMNPYIIAHDAPKIAKLKATYPEHYKD